MKLVLEGYRNYQDILWDIPIQKTTITANNFIAPPIHPSIYKNIPRVDNTSWKPVQRRKKVNLLESAFPGIHKIAEHNECDQLLKMQANLDHNIYHAVTWAMLGAL